MRARGIAGCGGDDEDELTQSNRSGQPVDRGRFEEEDALTTAVGDCVDVSGG